MADNEATDGQELLLLERRTSRTRLNQAQDDECSDLLSKRDGLSIVQTVLSVCACTSGYGSMVIAVLVVSTGWLGLVTSVLINSSVIFTMVLIGRCWNMVREKHPSERHPYGAIGFEAYGCRARTVMNVLLVGCCFLGGATVPLAGSELILLIGGPALRRYFCYFPLAIGIVACLLSWLKTPKDIWPVSLLSFTCNCVAFLVIFVGLILSNGESSSSTTNGDTPEETHVLHHAEIVGVVMSISSIHYIFPTIQQDMKEPSSAGKVVLLSAGVNTVAVLSIIVTLYIIYGATLSATGNASALTLLPDGALKVLSSSLIMVHLVQVILFSNNPMYQFLEEKLDIQSDFSWKRLVLRPLIIFLQIFVQETVPQINLYFAIVGGVFLPPIGLFAPALCYLRLKRLQFQESGISKPPKLFLLETAVCWVIIGVTPLVMVAVLYVTVSEMAAGRTVFTVPCYANATLARP